MPSSYSDTYHDKAVRSEVTRSIVSMKSNVCPFAVRLAWHASGTFSKEDSSCLEKRGGSDGATMRFAPESTDGANAGLCTMIDVLRPVKKKFPHLSCADIWTLAGTQAVQLCGGPVVPFRYGRSDRDDDRTCPENGRLPDASKGAQHLRDIFYRMGFTDKEIVALSGAHTLGSCHQSRSGYDGPWTTDPLHFDNEYYKNLLELEWTKREWEGPLQFTDPTGKLMMLPTDMALIQDDTFRPFVEKYAADQQLFFADFAEAFGKLISLGCPEHCQPGAAAAAAVVATSEEAAEQKQFRDWAMHGSLDRMKQLFSKEENTTIDPNSKEPFSDRTPMHKAAYFGHAHVLEYLIQQCNVTDVNAKDIAGDTPLHDASRFGHVECVEVLLKAGADRNARNEQGERAVDLAVEYEKRDVVNLLENGGEGRGWLGRQMSRLSITRKGKVNNK